jgi:septal ring factor EnvC (AmiA/AmiB activator)
MQLPDFIKRMLGFAEKVEANLTASTELTAAKARVTELEGQVKTANDKIKEHETTIAANTAKISELEASGKAKDTQISDLTGQVATEKKRANETLAAQGLSPENIPAAETATGGEAGKGSAWDKYCALLSNPKTQREASKFYGENADAIIKSRKS